MALSLTLRPLAGSRSGEEEIDTAAILSRTCRGLDQSVSAALMDAGMNIQSTGLNEIEAD